MKGMRYTLHWSRLLPNEKADIVERAMSWNTRRGMLATEVADLLETTIIPKKLSFELCIRTEGTETAPIMEGDEFTIRINRDFAISPTILKALS